MTTLTIQFFFSKFYFISWQKKYFLKDTSNYTALTFKKNLTQYINLRPQRQYINLGPRLTFGESQESFLNSDGFMLALSSSLGDFKIFSGL